MNAPDPPETSEQGNHTIFCDESGFTGTRLSDKDQPHFVYASVAVSPDRAEEIVRETRERFRIGGKELKGSSLVKSPKGRTAVSFVLETCLGNSKCMVINKKYALACKLYEYIFEPVLSDKGGIFYRLGFNRFVATLLFAELCTSDKSSEWLFARFEELMRSQNAEGISEFFGERPAKRRTFSVAKEVMAFAHAQRVAILDELGTITRLGDVGKWTLDVTDAALFSLLCHWGAQFSVLDVSCDESKPLFAYLNTNHSLFKAMIGRTDKQLFDFDGRGARQITFNLARPVSLVGSEDTPGIQLADVISASISWGLRHVGEPESREWLQLVDRHDVMHQDSILPDLEGFTKERTFRVNSLLLKELVRRSRKNEDLLEKIEDFIVFPLSL